MGKPRVLIVDDQKDVVRLLHSAIDSMGHDIEVIEAPSGEEALLEVSRNPVDLLVVDYLLPGISGIELMQKMRAKNDQTQTIVVTGQTARHVHREIMNASAQAFFVKPVPMADFLDAVERCLGLMRTILPIETYSNQDLQKENLTDLILNLREKIDALSVVLINERGLPMIRAGELQGVNREASLFSAFRAMVSAGVRVATALEQGIQHHFFAFRGDEYDFLAFPVTTTHLLLVSGPQFASDEKIADLLSTINSVRAEARELLRSLGIEDVIVEAEDAAQPDAVDESVDDDEPIAEDLAQLLDTGATLLDKDPNLFWDEAVTSHTPQPFSADVISYEQASQLGLAPDDDVEEDLAA